MQIQCKDNPELVASVFVLAPTNNPVTAIQKVIINKNRPFKLFFFKNKSGRKTAATLCDKMETNAKVNAQ